MPFFRKAGVFRHVEARQVLRQSKVFRHGKEPGHFI
jgi:hypothetical protein